MTDLTDAERVAIAKPIAAALLRDTGHSVLMNVILTAELAALLRHEPEVIATIWDPASCPTPLLSWLAYALSVDVWDSTWPQERKRAVIAASPMVHRLKGTLSAVIAALEALGMRPHITEWWETDPIGQRGTFDITVYVNEWLEQDESILSARAQQEAQTSVTRTKPKSRTFSFQLGVGLETEIGLASSGRAVGLAKGEGEMKLPTMGSAAGLGVSGRALGFVARDGEAKLPSMGAGFALGAQSRAIMYLQISGELQ
ncbi:phage tail protein I [uncultured Cohaesibacter sp.]|uniref:phage tail protein I n=1 Tax=uncultured Cohaesibacter sp. TaxID=1002546 RepID=UPI002AABD82A|nr:phage tail protein I [uncultured Cohaesibacter sp.]